MPDDLVIGFTGLAATVDLRARLREARRRRAQHRRRGSREPHWNLVIQNIQERMRQCPSTVEFDFVAGGPLYSLEVCVAFPRNVNCEVGLRLPPAFDSGIINGYEAAVHIAADPSGNPAMSWVRVWVGLVLSLSQVVQIQPWCGGTIVPVGTSARGILGLVPEIE
jgi:hypothetical protein